MKKWDRKAYASAVRNLLRVHAKIMIGPKVKAQAIAAAEKRVAATWPPSRPIKRRHSAWG